MVGHGAKFGRKKEEAIIALLSQRSIEDAARAAHIGTNTLLRWMKESEFEAAYREARRAAFGQAVSRLQQASGAAASMVLKLMVDPNVPAAVRLRAAACALDRAAKAIEMDDIEVRISALERSADAANAGGTK
jgi:hypothetical protein